MAEAAKQTTETRPQAQQPAPETKPAPKPGQAQHPAPVLFESAISWSETKMPQLCIDVPAHTPYEKLFDPTFWANVSPRLPPGCLLWCRDEENTYLAQLIVRNSGRGWVKVEEVHKHEFKVATGAPEKAEKHGVEFVNPTTRWRVYRLIDNATIKAGFPDWESAHKAMLDHERVLAA